MDDFTHERWKTVATWEGYYEVSDLGRARSLPRLSSDGKQLKGRILRPRILPKTGYHRVCFSRAGQHYDMYIHRLVLEAFVGPCPDGLEARHWDGDPANNRLGNLFWGTHSENQQDTLRYGRNPRANRTHCPQGHPYDEENTYIVPGTTHRQCKACHEWESGRNFILGKQCARGGCTSPVWARDLCRPHYDQQRNQAKRVG